MEGTVTDNVVLETEAKRLEKLWLVVVGAALALGAEGRKKLFAAIDPRDCKHEALGTFLNCVKAGDELKVVGTATSLGVKCHRDENVLQAIIRMLQEHRHAHKVKASRGRLMDVSVTDPRAYIDRLRAEAERIEKELA